MAYFAQGAGARAAAVAGPGRGWRSARSLLSATNDITHRLRTVELLDKREYGPANGVRIGFYRVGMLFAGFRADAPGWSGWPWSVPPSAARCSRSTRRWRCSRRASSRAEAVPGTSPANCACCDQPLGLPRRSSSPPLLAWRWLAGTRSDWAASSRRARSWVVGGRTAGRLDARRRGALMVVAAQAAKR